MRVFLWVWIIGFTALVLLMPPMLEKLPIRQGEGARWRNKGAFGQSVLQSSIGETRVDIFRLIISLLAINFLPAVALWQYNEIHEWVQRHNSLIDAPPIWFALVFLVLMVGVVLIALVSPPASAKDPAKLLPTEDPDDWAILVDPTPTPIRRAIPVTQ